MPRRRARTATITLDELLAADAQLAKAHAMWSGDGYQMTNARLWLRKDRSWTARVVWRRRAEPVSLSVVYTVTGLALNLSAAAAVVPPP